MFHVKHEPWVQSLRRAGLPDLSRDQTLELDRYEGLLRDRALSSGMISDRDRHRLRERHILDSLRGGPLLPGATRTVCDLGSGAGLPGIPIAIAFPDVRFTLAEARRTRAAFLELAVQELGLPNVEVHAGPAEELAGPYDACLARAFAAPAAAWSAAAPLLPDHGLLVYWAGETFDAPGFERETHVRVRPATSTLAGYGPVVIMSRQ
jgi:16S rRNA (guanine(527)-N(7))-methyltransferase RsmG